MRFMRLACVTALFMALVGNAHAQVQRMALGIGEYIVRAGSEVLMRAFCMDLDRPEPKTSTVFTSGFGPSASVRVQYGERIYSAEEAIKAGILEFRGAGMDGVIPRVKVAGDVHISVSHPYGLMTDPNDAPIKEHFDAVASIIKGAREKGAGSQRPATLPLGGIDVQDSVWDASATVQRQVLLHDLGYDVGEPDGIEGPRYRAFLLATWTHHSISATSSVNSPTTLPSLSYP